MKTERHKPAVPQMQKMLGKAAANRIARAANESRRRRGSGIATIAVVGLLLGGSAMAAAGVWNPLGGGSGPDQQSPPSRAADGLHSGLSSVVPPGLSRDPVRRRNGGENRGSKAATPYVVDGSTIAAVGRPASEDASDQVESGHTGSPRGVAGAVAPDPKLGANVVRDKGAEPEPEGSTPTGKETPAALVPGNSGTSLLCLDSQVGVGNPTKCLVTVSGEGPSPTGTVRFQTSSSGDFAPESCELVVNNDGTASCTAAYVPNTKGLHQVTASYEGDSTHAPSSSTSFSIEGQ